MLDPNTVQEKSLSKREEKELAACEAVIDTHQKNFWPVGMALKEIRDQRLHRAYGMDFEEYCGQIWDLCESRVYQFIDGAAVMENLHNCGGFTPQLIEITRPENTKIEKTGVLPATVFRETGKTGTVPFDIFPVNESQARPLTPLPAAEQILAWSFVIETAKKDEVRITAALVRQCVRAFKGEKFREAIEQADKDAEDTANQRGAYQERGWKISKNMDRAFRVYLEAMSQEFLSKWRNTSREMVLKQLRELLNAVETL